MKYLPVLTAAALAAILSCSAAPGTNAGHKPRVNVPAAPRLAYIHEDGEGRHEYGTMRIDGSARRPLLTLTGQRKEPSEFGAPRGDKLVVTTGPDAVTPAKMTILNFARGRRVATITAPQMAPGDELMWTPDQTAFLAGSMIVDADTGETITPKGIDGRSRQALWSADGKYLAGCGSTSGSSSPALIVWARDGTQAPAVQDPGGESPDCTAWTWARNRLLFSTARTTPRMFSYSPATGKVTRHTAPAEQRHGSYSLHPPENCPAQRHVQAVTSESALTGDGTWKPRDGYSCDRVPSPDGSRWAGLDENRHLVIGDADSGSSTQLTFHSDQLRRDYTFTRDGLHLLFQNGAEFYVADLEPLKTSKRGSAYSWAYSPQLGKLIIVRADRRSITITDFAGAMVNRRLPGNAHSKIRLGPGGRFALVDASPGPVVIDLADGATVPGDRDATLYWPHELGGEREGVDQWEAP